MSIESFKEHHPKLAAVFAVAAEVGTVATVGTVLVGGFILRGPLGDFGAAFLSGRAASLVTFGGVVLRDRFEP